MRRAACRFSSIPNNWLGPSIAFTIEDAIPNAGIWDMRSSSRHIVQRPSNGPHRLRLKLESGTSDNSRIKLTLLEAGSPRPFSIFLKLPHRLDPPRIAVNGRLRPANSRQGYVRLHRRWETGDIVEVTPSPISTMTDPALTPMAES